MVKGNKRTTSTKKYRKGERKCGGDIKKSSKIYMRGEKEIRKRYKIDIAEMKGKK
jgi:hypothetical protein